MKAHESCARLTRGWHEPAQAAPGPCLEAAICEAQLRAFGTDSIPLQIRMGTQGRIGVVPPGIDEIDVGTQACDARLTSPTSIQAPKSCQVAENTIGGRAPVLDEVNVKP